MRLLADTHVLLWFASGSVQASRPAREAWRTAAERWVSAASAYEIAYKVKLGRLEGGQSVLDGWERLLTQLRARELPLSVAHMARAGSLDWDHRDPFDRMLTAQAQLDGLTVLTADGAMRDFSGVATLSADR